MDEINHKATFPAPVFSSRVVEGRLRIQASGQKFVWDEAKQEFVLKEPNAEISVRLKGGDKSLEQDHGKS